MSKKEQVMEALEELTWDDDKIQEIMPDIYNSPMEAIDNSGAEFSEEHINTLFETLELKEEEDEDEKDENWNFK